ncbi:hypothetical protein JW964_14850 [candidate division KSB1 bacterium]|nr:hypothetical protein [candidate division KSB1 bacterium]
MLKISDELANYVTDLFSDEVTDKKIKRLIENEIIRRLTRYQHTIRILELKYQMDFDTFKLKNIVSQKKFSEEVENDFCNWEMSIDGVHSMEKKLNTLRGLSNDYIPIEE